MKPLTISFFLSFCFSIQSLGETLYSTVLSSPPEGQLFYTYLIDNNNNILNEWEHEECVAHTPYLTSDSILVRPARVSQTFFNAGGVGGQIEKIDWDGNILWNYLFANTSYQQHHDIEILPNGNILFISFSRKSQEDALLAGKYQQTNDVWSESIFEIQPVGSDSAVIIWEWHLWDHLIQDRMPEADNYGSVIDNPKLFDINYMLSGSDEGPLPPGFSNPDIVHLNAIDYCESLDLIVVSSRVTSEVYIIDHSTTTLQATGHEFGNYNSGGDLIYRWGNPVMYNRGGFDDRKLFAPHGVNWINGCESLLIFNNGQGRPEGNFSSVDEILLPPLDQNGYEIVGDLPYAPTNLSWYYADESLYSAIQSGAYRLSNNNTLITYTQPRKIREIDSDGNVLWEHNHLGNELVSRSDKYNFRDGDVNNDEIVNVLDILLLVNFIIDNVSYIALYDINYDNSIDILDIIKVVNIILE